jgi:hypothetical protein
MEEAESSEGRLEQTNNTPAKETLEQRRQRIKESSQSCKAKPAKIQ